MVSLAAVATQRFTRRRLPGSHPQGRSPLPSPAPGRMSAIPAPRCLRSAVVSRGPLGRDLLPSDSGGLAAVIDFAGSALADPTVDLLIAWEALDDQRHFCAITRR